MKHLYIIGGTMGAGKTTVCQLLKLKLPNSVFLDGDWCWDMHPFKVTEETKVMVVSNICFLLNSFLHCSEYENIIFCWVMHQQAIIDDILSRLDTSDCEVRTISLVLNEEALRKRMQADIDRGLREPEGIERSLPRLPLYEELNTIKIDVSDISPDRAAELIAQLP